LAALVRHDEQPSSLFAVVDRWPLSGAYIPVGELSEETDLKIISKNSPIRSIGGVEAVKRASDLGGRYWVRTSDPSLVSPAGDVGGIRDPREAPGQSVPVRSVRP
jgi:hypothetical protein